MDPKNPFTQFLSEPFDRAMRLIKAIVDEKTLAIR